MASGMIVRPLKRFAEFYQTPYVFSNQTFESRANQFRDVTRCKTLAFTALAFEDEITHTLRRGVRIITSGAPV
jgi:hypothetical protein